MKYFREFFDVIFGVFKGIGKGIAGLLTGGEKFAVWFGKNFGLVLAFAFLGAAIYFLYKVFSQENQDMG